MRPPARREATPPPLWCATAPVRQTVASAPRQLPRPGGGAGAFRRLAPETAAEAENARASPSPPSSICSRVIDVSLLMSTCMSLTFLLVGIGVLYGLLAPQPVLEERQAASIHSPQHLGSGMLPSPPAVVYSASISRQGPSPPRVYPPPPCPSPPPPIPPPRVGLNSGVFGKMSLYQGGVTLPSDNSGRSSLYGMPGLASVRGRMPPPAAAMPSSATIVFTTATAAAAASPPPLVKTPPSAPRPPKPSTPVPTRASAPDPPPSPSPSPPPPVLLPPPLPSLARSSPPPLVSPVASSSVVTASNAVAEQINRRFREGRASNDLRQAGVLLHLFDGDEVRRTPWLPRSGAVWWSSSVISRQVGTVFADHSGFVLSPATAVVRCAFPSDGGTRGSGDGGCGRGFCVAPGVPVWNCPYKTLAPMLERHLQHGDPQHRYNEVKARGESGGCERSQRERRERAVMC